MIPVIGAAAATVIPGLIKELPGVLREAAAKIKDPNLAAKLQSKADLAESATDNRVLDAYIAEMAQPPTGWFDSVVNGINRLVRPVITFAAFGMVAWPMIDPASYKPRIDALRLIPIELWTLVGVIMAFWFGSRSVFKDRPAARIKVETAKSLRSTSEIAVAQGKDREIAASVAKTERRIDAVEADNAALEREMASEGNIVPHEPPAGTTPPDLPSWLPPLLLQHDRGGVSWRLTADGVSINGAPPTGTSGRPETVTRIVEQYGDSIQRWAEHYQVPAELIVATIATESKGNPSAYRLEPDDRFSAGLMQTLQGTATDALRTEVDAGQIDKDWLMQPDNSIRAGTAYIARQFRLTGFDPPLVAAAYNAGSVRPDTPKFGRNRWNLEAYDGGKDQRESLDGHIDRYVAWFNDSCRAGIDLGGQSFAAALRRATI